MSTGFRQSVPGSNRDPKPCARSRRNAAAMSMNQSVPFSLPVTPIDITADYNMHGGEGLLLVSVDNSMPTVYLPAASDLPDGQIVYIKNTESVNEFSIDVAGGGLIDGGAGGFTCIALGGHGLIVGQPAGGTRQWYRLER